MFKMILDGAKDHERSIARGFLKHIVVGFGVGLAVGSLVLIGLFIIFAEFDLHVPLVFVGAALLQFGPIGGLIGAGVHLSRIAERAAPADEDEDDEGPGRGTEATQRQGTNKVGCPTVFPTVPWPA